MTRIVSFLIRRAAAAAFTLLALILITFVVYWAIPTSPEGYVYPFSQHLSDYQIHHADQLLGLTRSKPDQYVHYVWGLLHGNFGGDWGSGRLVNNTQFVMAPIGPQIWPLVRKTLSIILGGALIVLLLAVPLGGYAGSKIGSIGDRTISTASLVGICTHPMVLGLILSTELGAKHLGWLPSDGYCPFLKPQGGAVIDPNGGTLACGGPQDWALHLILPWLTFALIFLALYTRMVRASVADTLHEDYVRTARSKGASELRVMRSHVLPSAGLRVLTMVGMEIGTAIGICIYIEAAFNIGGLGQQAIFVMGGASATLNLPYTLAVVTVITLIVIVGNLIVDLLYAVLDPRVGRETGRGGQKAFAGGII